MFAKRSNRMFTQLVKTFFKILKKMEVQRTFNNNIFSNVSKTFLEYIFNITMSTHKTHPKNARVQLIIIKSK